MEEETGKKKKSIYLFFLWMFLIFIIIDLGLIIFANIVTQSSFINKYGSELITEMFYALSVLIVMLLFNNAYVFTNKKEKFINGVKLAVPMLVITALNLFSSISSLTSFSLSKFINVIIFCILIGIAEEFLCRGWIQNEFIERYSENKRSVILSIVLSSLVFGLMHITNIYMQSLFETILQIINATALGILLGSIYYKTKNIWSVICLHAMYDAAIIIGEMNLIKDCTYNDPTLGVTIVNGIGIILISAIWILSAVLVLRKTNFPDKKPSKSNDNRIVTAIVILFFSLFIPLENFVPEYSEYKVCYSYNEIEKNKDYTLHFPYYNEYEIEYEKEIETTNELDKTTELFNYKFTLNSDNTISIKNEINDYETKLKYNDVVNFELLENENNYLFVVQTSENETTIYYSDFITKDNLEQGSDYLEKFKESFKIFELPEINSLGYATLDNTNTKYPYMISSNNDYFIIKNSELYLIKK